MPAHFNTEVWLSPIQTVAPWYSAFFKSSVGDWWINSLWENKKIPDILLHTLPKEKSQQQHFIGAIECTVNGRCNYPIAVYWEKILHVLPLLSLIYADLFNRCFVFSYQCKSTPLQVWKDKKSHVNLLYPPITPYTVAQPHGLVCQGVMCVVQ